jgi:hypothetical protein
LLSSEDNSGRRGDIGWDENDDNVERTKAVLVTLTKEFSKPEYGKSNVFTLTKPIRPLLKLLFERAAQVVAGIQPLNEPAGFKGAHMLDTVKEFYKGSAIVKYLHF